MTTKDREAKALEAIDHGFPANERDNADWNTVAIVHALLAIAEAINNHPRPHP